jgi:hypothetical protein
MGNSSSGFNFHQTTPRQTPDQRKVKYNPSPNAGPDREVSDGGGEGFMLILGLVISLFVVWLLV